MSVLSICQALEATWIGTVVRETYWGYASPQLAHRRAVGGHAPPQDQFLAMATRALTGVGQVFVETIHGVMLWNRSL